jgi:hypothetical protein
MLGQFMIHFGPHNSVCARGGFPKITDMNIGFSRDGVNWMRSPQRPFVGSSRRPGTWNGGYVHNSGGVCLKQQIAWKFRTMVVDGHEVRLQSCPPVENSSCVLSLWSLHNLRYCRSKAPANIKFKDNFRLNNELPKCSKL